jgi:Fe-S-cluster containining protein
MPAHQTPAFFRDVANNMKLREPDRYDAAWIVENWDVIGPSDGSLFYSCKLVKGNLCTKHGTRPDVCRCFPTYGLNKIHPGVRLHPGCGYAPPKGI